MSDETPRPDADHLEEADDTAVVPTPAASGPVAQPAAPASGPVAQPAVTASGPVAQPAVTASGPVAEPAAMASGPVGQPAVAASVPPTAAAPAAQPAPAAAIPPGGRWWNRRVPLVIIGVALLLGCVLGAGVAAVGVFVGDALHGDGRGHSTSDMRPGGGNRDFGNGNGDRRNGRGDRQNQNNPPAPANSAVPSPSASS